MLCINWLRFLIIVTISITLLQGAAYRSAVAQTADKTAHTCPVNGCGPDGWFGIVVPNEVAGCNFKRACDAHDLCYAKCLPCHSFSDSPLCYGLDNKKARRKECDASFKQSLTKAAGSSTTCLIAADAYHFAVRKLGNSFHRGEPPTKDEADEFKQAFEAEFARLKKE
jgi:hypothetical protein